MAPLSERAEVAAKLDVIERELLKLVRQVRQIRNDFLDSLDDDVVE